MSEGSIWLAVVFLLLCYAEWKRYKAFIRWMDREERR